MKKIRKVLSLTLAVLMMVSVFTVASFSVSAAETGKSLAGVSTFKDENTKTVIKFENGKTETVNNAVKAESLEANPIVDDVKSYEVVYKAESVIKVEPRDINYTGSAAALNGYYALTFTIPNTEKEVFLTGLSAANVDVVEKKLIANYSDDKDFVMEELDFIDAEKELNGKDELLCWAGTNSNMLRYTGWAQQAGFETEDELLETFSQNFVDDGYQVSGGLHWFFDGQTSDSVKVKGSGRYFPDYMPDEIIQDCEVNRDFAQKGPKLISDLKAGKGIGLTVEWLDADGGFSDMAHAITLFGVITDNSYDENNLYHYDSFIIADSDNSTAYDRSGLDNIPDRRYAPNTLTITKLEPYINEEYNYSTVIGKNYGGVLALYTSLEPYSDAMSVYKETDPDATLNRNNTNDFGINDVYLSNGGGGARSEKVYSEDVFVSFSANDKSSFAADNGTSFAGKIKISLTLSDSEGQPLYTTWFKKDYNLNETDIYGDFTLGDLDAGQYKATITVNSDHAVSEAFFINNSKTVDFEVVDKAYDMSSVKVSIDTDTIEFGDTFNTVVNLQYSGLDTCPLCSEYDEANVYYSIYDNGRWLLWEKVREKQEDSGEAAGKSKAKVTGSNAVKESDLPETAIIPAIGSRVKFRLEYVKDSVAYSTISGEYPFSMYAFEVGGTDNNTEQTSVIPQGANKLCDGEQFAFYIENTSIGDHEAIEGTFVLAADTGKDLVNITDSVPFRVETGERTAEFAYSSWDENIELLKTCDIYVVINANGFDESYVPISVLRIQEDKSTTVTTAEDITDGGDGNISFREAVAYAEETGTEVTIGEDVDNILSIDSAININKSVKINGYYDGSEMEGNRVSIVAGCDKEGKTKEFSLFKIGKDANVEIKNTKLSSGKTDKGAAVYVDGGTVNFEDCQVGFCEATDKGGAVFLNGGNMIAKNTDFVNNTAPYGTDIFIDGGAKAEILNCNLVPAVETSGIIYNYNGSLNLINSSIMPGDTDTYDEYENGKLFNRAIISNKNTNVINSIVFTRNSTAISGDVNVYSSVTNGTDAEVKCDSTTIVREIEEICRINEEGTPVFDYFDRDHFAPYLSEEAKLGSFTSIKDGKIVLTDSQGGVTETGINTAFTNEELSIDFMGNTRTSFFGSFADILVFGALLDDENTIISGVDNMVYTGAPITQKFEVHYYGMPLDYGVDYTVSYENNINAGTATIIVTGMNDYRGSVTNTFIIKKAANPMTVSTAVKTVKYSKVKKAKQTVKNAVVVKKNQGAVTCKKTGGSSKLTISNKGVITVKKGTKKGTYKIKVKVTAKGNLNYSAKSVTKTVTVKVK